MRVGMLLNRPTPPVLITLFTGMNSLAGFSTGLLVLSSPKDGTWFLAAFFWGVGTLFGISTVRAFTPERPFTSSLTSCLDLWSMLLPTRIANEDLGGYVEEIDDRLARGQRVLALIHALAAVLRTGVNAVWYFVKTIGIRTMR